MRGRPLLEWGVFILAWGLLLVPLGRLSAGRAARSPSREALAAPAVTAPAWVRVLFSEPPGRFVLLSGGIAVWEGHGEEDREERLDLAWTDAGPSLEIEAQWPGPGRRAVEIRVAPLDGRPRRTTVWTGAARLRERMVFE